MRIGLDKARVYSNGIVIAWKGERIGQTRDVLTAAARKTRKFSVKRTRLQSACVAAWAGRQSQFMLFITFTFPFDPDENQARKIWDLFLKSLRKTYNVRHYVWVKERQKAGRLHYHLLIDRNRIDIKKLQTTYNGCINNICPGIPCSFNSVRLGSNPIVKTVGSVARYLSKYISKTDNVYEKRACGWSDLSLYQDLTTDELMEMIMLNGIQYKTIHVSETFSVYYLVSYPEIIYPPGKRYR